MDFPNQLSKQLEYIERSCELYDHGHRNEAIRVATALRVIFHNTSNSTSLLAHLNALHVDVASSLSESTGICIERQGATLIDSRLAKPHLSFDFPTTRFYFEPFLVDTNIAQIPLQRWWDGEVVAVVDGHSFSRKTLILAAANKDGGAHVDGELPEDYRLLTEAAPIARLIKEFMPTSDISVEDLHHATIRQIAFEVFASPDVIALTHFS